MFRSRDYVDYIVSCSGDSYRVFMAVMINTVVNVNDQISTCLAFKQIVRSTQQWKY